MSARPTWDLIGSFLVVMREGSLSAAARSLGLTQPTIRRHIEALEAELKVTLFTRTTSGLLPTDAANEALQFAETMSATADALVRAASGADREIAGTVRVTSSEIMAIELIPAMLAPLLSDNPALDIELVASNRTENLLRRDADIAVRMARPTQDALIAQRVGTVALGLHASRSYVDKHGTPTSISELQRNHVLVGEDRQTLISQAFRSFGLDPRDCRFNFRVDSDAAQFAAIRAGIGIGVCQYPLARRDETLVEILPDMTLGLEIFVVMHEDMRLQARTRCVFDHLVVALKRYVSLD